MKTTTTTPRLTAAQRRALGYLARHDGWAPTTRLVPEDAVALQRLSRKDGRLVSYLPLGAGMAYMLTPAGRAALEAGEK